MSDSARPAWPDALTAKVVRCNLLGHRQYNDHNTWLLCDHEDCAYAALIGDANNQLEHWKSVWLDWRQGSWHTHPVESSE